MTPPTVVTWLTGLLATMSCAAGPAALPGRWLDDQGRELVSFGGEAPPTMVVTMAYGSCRRVCSSVLRTMKKLQLEADRRQLALPFVVVGLDPQQDRPADWASFRRDHGLHRANWYFLSGSAQDTQRLAARLDLRYWRYGEHIVHDYRIALVAADGRVLRQLVRPDQDPAMLLDR
jgi:cytochrome oxidase Cu insertion factor (SCO1/SenC/PrrC family)